MATHTTKNSTDQFLQTLPMQSGPFPLVAGWSDGQQRICRSLAIGTARVSTGLNNRGNHQCGLRLGLPEHGHWNRQATLAERAQTPHHLIDILDPAQSYSAAQFARDARSGDGDDLLILGAGAATPYRIRCC